MVINNKGVWVNPDMNKDICDSNFNWFECISDECKFGVDNYDGEGGLCCGDDKGESGVKCEGGICNSNAEKPICCPENNCAFGNKCYRSGCAKINLENGSSLDAFCDKGKWVDLDKSFCAECLGKAHG